MIVRDGAVEFLCDLKRRLRTFEEHPTGQTPSDLFDIVIELVRSNDQVGLDVLLREERVAYQAAVQEVEAAAQAIGVPNAEATTRVWDLLHPHMERRLASLLALGLYAPDKFEEEIYGMATALSAQPIRAGYTVWNEVAAYAATWLG